MERTKQKSWRAIVVGFVAVTLGGFRSTAWSEDVAPPSIEERLSALEHKQDSAVLKASAADGFQIQSLDKAFVLKFRGLLQIDSRQYVSDPSGHLTSQFLVRRARPILEGTIARSFSFLLTPEMASNGKTTLIDAYLDFAPWTYAKLRAGKFKPPIGLEHLQSDPNVIFSERGFPNNLVPTRDTGIQFYGDLAQGAISYAAMIANGTGDGNVNTQASAPVTSDTDINDGKEGTFRLSSKPFKRTRTPALQGFGIGLSASYAKQAVVNPTYASPGQNALITTAAAALPDGEKIRWAPDLNWYYRSWGVYGEYVRSSQVYRVTGSRSRVVNEAWQADVSYVLTGETATFTGVTPNHPFDVKEGTWGAWQVAARIGQLYVDPDNFSRGALSNATSIQRAETFGVGINWYMNPILRWSTSFDQTQFDGGAAVGDRATEKIVISRWQLSF